MISKEAKITRIGIVGSGFIAKGLFDLIISKNEFQILHVLTRSDIDKRENEFNGLLTNSIEELIDNSDLVIECSGNIIYAAEVLEKVMQHNIPVITMNTEFQVTIGSYFVDKGFITEAEGDQPGCLAILNEEAVQMGFKPLVYGNIKGFLNNNPTKEDMDYWSNKSNISVNMVTSFTDGTKVQMEQAFVANGLAATIIKTGLTGLEGSNIKSHGDKLACVAEELQSPISDYVVSAEGPPGVFITASHDQYQHASLKYYKMGEGPFYTLIKQYHLPHLEIYKTILRVVNGGGVLLNNGEYPTISVAAIAKKDLNAGQKINKAIGSFEMRGEAIKIEDCIGHVPIGLIEDVILKRDIKKDAIVMFDDIEINENIAIMMWHEILKKVTK